MNDDVGSFEHVEGVRPRRGCRNAIANVLTDKPAPFAWWVTAIYADGTIFYHE